MTFKNADDRMEAVLPAFAVPLLPGTKPAPLGAPRASSPVDLVGLYGLVAVGATTLLLLGVMFLRRHQKSAAPVAPDATAGSTANEETMVLELDNVESLYPAASTVVGCLYKHGDPSTRYMLTNELFTVGRSSENDLTLRDPSISRHHAEIRHRPDGSFLVTDLESMNGIYVNEKRVRSTMLKDGDTLEFGDVIMHFTLERRQDDHEEIEETLDMPKITPFDIDDRRA
ncbi:MAG: FHA domain-containing protein [Pseudomonadota bacterium]